MQLFTWKNSLIALLILLNAAALSTIFGHHTTRQDHQHHGYHEGDSRQHEQPKGFHDKRPPLDRILQERLSFSDEQMAAFELAKDKHHQASQQLQEESRKLKNELFDQITTDNEDAARDISKRIGENKEALEWLTYEHFKELRAICKEDQLDEFDEIIKRIAQQMHAGPGHPPGPPGEGGLHH